MDIQAINSIGQITKNPVIILVRKYQTPIESDPFDLSNLNTQDEFVKTQ